MYIYSGFRERPRQIGALSLFEHRAHVGPDGQKEKKSERARILQRGRCVEFAGETVSVRIELVVGCSEKMMDFCINFSFFF